jgi:hypothetical protein
MDLSVRASTGKTLRCVTTGAWLWGVMRPKESQQEDAEVAFLVQDAARAVPAFEAARTQFTLRAMPFIPRDGGSVDLTSVFVAQPQLQL